MSDPTFLGLHLHLRQISTRSLPTTAEDPARSHAGETTGNQDGATAENAPAHPVSGTLAETSRYWPLRLLCRPHKQSGALSVPTLRGRSLASYASAAQPERRLYVGPDDEVGRRLASRAAHPSSMARPALRRQTPEVRAGCSNRACPDLCGGCSAMGIPTAIQDPNRTSESYSRRLTGHTVVPTRADSPTPFRYLAIRRGRKGVNHASSSAVL